ncbi:hypothetical protein A2Y85_05330 [candidate division WOR-3 bacterium RBG_13_43_14]|uniref:Cytosolic protein n=1 Tax=candidate division WOR-3 bacterium RBG_13_43_14 TaxID=1802590 RepID=A0A1F4U1S7_UNCW3|nr:MAG: hypothetical protein A2Y85_05330 [candidate division WOR-3 bacterium RBG_13_43_14]
MLEPKDISKEQLLLLLQDAAKNWIAHDGLWFLETEKKFGIDTAIELDRNAWEQFTQIEAKRIMQRLQIRPNSGIPALIQALKFRLYAYINVQKILEVTDNRCVFRMLNCRVQESRKRRNLPDFPCKPVGIVEYSNFAKTIDPRIKTTCLCCPPDAHPDDFYCSWEFKIE